MAPTDAFARESQRALPIWLLAACVLLLALRIGSHFMGDRGEASLIHWVGLEEAVAQSRALHRPILYDFSAAWCGPCQQMEGELFHDSALVARINSRVVPVRVIDRQQEDGANAAPIAASESRFAVRGFPTVVLAADDSRELKRMEGYGGRGTFERLIP